MKQKEEVIWDEKDVVKCGSLHVFISPDDLIAAMDRASHKIRTQAAAMGVKHFKEIPNRRNKEQ